MYWVSCFIKIDHRTVSNIATVNFTALLGFQAYKYYTCGIPNRAGIWLQLLRVYMDIELDFSAKL